MKVLVLTHHPKHLKNPYVGTLLDEVQRIDPAIRIDYGYRHFWTDKVFDYDIVHNMWPDVLRRKGHTLADIDRRLAEIRARGVRVLSTCHNLVAHEDRADDAYDVLYRHSDTIFHLGSYSRELMKERYPQALHYAGAHHVYDTLYTDCAPSRGSHSRPHVVCIGAFRSDRERRLVADVAAAVPEADFYCPSYCRKWREWLKLRWRHTLPANLKVSYGALPDRKLSRICSDADVMLVQRTGGLNSGNVTLGLLFGMVVAGPAVGNIGEAVADGGGFVFNPADTASVAGAVRDAIALAGSDAATDIHSRALSRLGTHVVAEMMRDAYLQTMKR